MRADCKGETVAEAIQLLDHRAPASVARAIRSVYEIPCLGCRAKKHIHLQTRLLDDEFESMLVHEFVCEECNPEGPSHIQVRDWIRPAPN